MKQRKNRMVSFRLSDDEYVALKDVCESQGARSMSEVARAAVHKYLAPGADWGDTAIRSRLDSLDERVKVLDLALVRLAQIVEPASRRGTA